jgi:hypothetical protein
VCRAKMVEGRVQKNLKEQSLLEQKFWKDDTKTVAEVLKEAINTLGENIKVCCCSLAQSQLTTTDPCACFSHFTRVTVHMGGPRMQCA